MTFCATTHRTALTAAALKQIKNPIALNCVSPITAAASPNITVTTIPVNVHENFSIPVIKLTNNVNIKLVVFVNV